MIKTQPRYFVPFLAGPTNSNYLTMGWLNLVFSLLFYWITASFFQTPTMTSLFLIIAIFSIACIAFSFMKRMTQQFEVISMALVFIQIIILIFLIDFMALLMFLSGFGSEKNLNLATNLPLSIFITIIGLLFLGSLIYFAGLYRKNQNRSETVSQKKEKSRKEQMAKDSVIVFAVILLAGSFIKGKVATFFGLALAILCTFLFSALIIDAIYGMRFVKNRSSNK
ncbi:hypothetical protein [Streptococcus uberis]|uniref:hypothetical protein n=1 Tax=Streptococcus uberis TaxID=1349 RepID=UPI0012B57880|nr:hypothetical protein [Streptococcus uberis]MTB69253.1 hypothetical protein [Streptococcus uberis]